MHASHTPRVCLSNWVLGKGNVELAKTQDILASIHLLESQNKASPNIFTADKLAKLRIELRTLLNENHNIMLRQLNLKYFAQHNRISSLSLRSTTFKIPYLYHSTTSKRVKIPQVIADDFADYYASLYNLAVDPNTSQPLSSAISAFLDHLHLPSLAPSDLADLNCPFTDQETVSVIKTLPKGKSPGPDRFSNDYYQTFGDCLAPSLIALYNAVTEKAAFPSEMLRAHNLRKLGKDPDCPANFRPISLLNSDVKLYAKIQIK